METEVCLNGFVKVTERDGVTVHFVKGVHAWLRGSLDPANASRPSCTCYTENFFSMCAHVKAAEKHVRAANTR